MKFRHCINFCGVLAVALVTFRVSRADDSRIPPTSFECRYTTTTPRIDGKPNDAAWKSAQLIDNFYLPWLQNKARPSKTTTKARLLWDRHNLYFLAELEDGDLFADITEHDGRTWHNDVFELFFKPDENKPAYYEFQINAAGTVMDMFIPAWTRDLFKKYIAADEFHIESKVILRGKLNDAEGKDRGWTVEGRIPWRDFKQTGGRPAAGDRWKFALCRYDYSNAGDKPELSTNAPLKSRKGPDFHAHEDYATLTFVGPAPIGVAHADAGEAPRARLDALLRDFGTVRSTVIGSPDPPPPFRVRRVLPKLKLTNPITVVNEPGSRRLLIIDQKSADGASRLYRTTETPQDGKLETLLDFPKSSIAFNIAFHPRFDKNGYIYIGWNGPHDPLPKSENWTGPLKDKHTIVTRYTLDRKHPYKLDPDSALEIISWPSNGHNGAAVAFGHDGMLYITSGDGTSDSDTDVTGQGMSHLLAKLLRIDIERPANGRRYSVPEDNPFVGRKGIRPETWAYGFRNPWRMTVDQQTGGIWVGNNGQDLWEQAYYVQRGANYGWSVYEGGHEFYPTRKLGPTPHVKPTVEHPHSEFRSLTGGVVYYGNRFPELRGVYIYGDHSTGKIWGARVENHKLVWNKELADTTLHISDFALDADGELLVLDYQGKELGGLYEFVRTPPAAANKNFPRKLSQSGLFASVAGHRLHSGVIPYSVNAALWSDGAYKERALYVPEATGDDEKPTKINVRGSRGWDFPDGSVAIKSFALDMTEGDPTSRRWIETRFLTKHEGEWLGYSYLWNDEQTDATLVRATGADHTFTIRTADGATRQLPWRYPSRSECMVCHSRASKYLLGLSSVQMNKTHTYGGVEAHQFEVLESLGLATVVWDDAAEQGNTHNARTPKGIKRLVDPYDETANLTDRARSYLHANCAQCHVEAGGGNSQMNLEFTRELDKAKLIDVPPVHHKFGIKDARLIAPGAPDRSVLLHRISTRARGKMPQLATSKVDTRAVKLFREWILTVEKPKAVEKPKPVEKPKAVEKPKVKK